MPGGRPLKFQTVEELETKIEEYFVNVDESEWTWTGLALFLDTDKSTLQDYKEKPEFSHSLKRALQKVEYSYEKDLKKYGRTGTIFALKNFGDWKDKTEVDQNVKSADVSESLDVEQKQKIAKLLLNE